MIIFFFGISLMIVAPFLRRFNRAPLALAGGAFAVLAVAVIGLVHVDPRIGQAANESTRRGYLFSLACELPVLILGLISWKRFKWAFWVGWGINLAFSLLVLAIFVEIEFFWHS